MPQNNALPLWSVPIAETNGQVSQSWYQFFAGLTAQSAAIVPVTPSGSPFTYTASTKGTLSVSGGTVSNVSLSRARVTGVNVGFTSGLVPMSQGDIVRVTYSAPPTINFIPS